MNNEYLCDFLRAKKLRVFSMNENDTTQMCIPKYKYNKTCSDKKIATKHSINMIIIY